MFTLDIPEMDTIAAISTPYGESGIGIIRVSGPNVDKICSALFQPKIPKRYLASHQFYYGEIIEPRSHSPIDEVLLVLMRKPKTYTKEDCLEIHCHGGYLILQRILEAVIYEGAKLAQPGEFTKRAFLNGRIDLTQAEAVIDLIQSKTDVSLQIANDQRKGYLSNKINKLKEDLLSVIAEIEASIDFPEEELEISSLDKIADKIKAIIFELEELVKSYEKGHIFREGVTAVILGKPNVGKSSLLNSLLKEERAIVTPIPGTTRDFIEELIDLDGIPVKIIDTAGIKPSKNEIDKIGQKMTRKRVSYADIVIYVLDITNEIDQHDQKCLSEIEDKKILLVLNKVDLPKKVLRANLLKDRLCYPVVEISALHEIGFLKLKEEIHKLIMNHGIQLKDHLIINNLRHKQSLDKAIFFLINACKGFQKNLFTELISIDLREAIDALGEIVGETTSDDVLDNIFNRFCVGK